MNARLKISIVVLACLVLIGATFTATYLVMSAQQRIAIADAKLQATEAHVAQLEKSSANAEDAIAKRDREWLERTSNFERRLATIRTPQQAVAELNKRTPGLLTEVKSPLPDAPSSYVIPEDKVLPLNLRLARCDETDAAFTKCEADKKDLVTERDNSKAVAAEWQRQSTEWERAAKGGSKAKRVWSVLKVAVPVAAGGYLLGRLSK